MDMEVYIFVAVAGFVASFIDAVDQVDVIAVF